MTDDVNGHQPDEDPGDEPPQGSSAVDRNTRIERQASMHFASRIVAAKISDPQKNDLYKKGGRLSDEKIEEELNKWMTKFQRGVTTGKIQ